MPAIISARSARLAPLPPPEPRLVHTRQGYPEYNRDTTPVTKRPWIQVRTARLCESTKLDLAVSLAWPEDRGDYRQKVLFSDVVVEKGFQFAQETQPVPLQFEIVIGVLEDNNLVRFSSLLEGFRHAF